MIPLLKYLFESVQKEEDVKKIKEKILNLAFHGVLTNQNLESESASNLLQKLKIEKEKLIQDKYIQKEKTSLLDEKEEKPYYIPENWHWTKIGIIAYNLGQKKPQNDFTYIDVSTINEHKGEVTDNPPILKPHEAPSRARKIVEKDAVIYSTVRPYLLNIARINKEFKFEPIVSTAFEVLKPLPGVNSKFLFYYLRSPYMKKYVSSIMVGVAYPAINKKQLLNSAFPLPPTIEQDRIVNNIEYLFDICDQLAENIQIEKESSAILNKIIFSSFLNESSEKAEQAIQFAIEHMAELLETKHDVDLLRTGILSLAMRGKLVSQNVSEEPASNLLARVTEEKHRLIKDKKIKSAKTTSKVNLNEVPFKLPHQWEWARLGDYAFIERGVTFPASAKKEVPTKNDVLCATTSSVQTSFLPKKGVYIDSSYVKSNQKFVQENDVLISLANSYELVGKTCIAMGINDERITFGGFVGALRPLVINPYFFYLVMQYLYKTKVLQELSSQTTNIANLSGEKIKNVVVPCPPLEEQKRIASKVQELFQICDNLENHLLKRQNEQQILISSVSKV